MGMLTTAAPPNPGPGGARLLLIAPPAVPPTGEAAGSTRRAGRLFVAAQHTLEQLDVLAEVPWAKEQVAYARLRRCTHTLRVVGVV